jgi:hypothetical protein
LLLITAVSRRQKVRDGSTTLYSFSVGCEHEPIACTGHAGPCEGSIRRCRIAECSGRRLPRKVAQLWLTSYRAWSDALSASGSQSALFSMVMYFQSVYERRSSTMAHSGPPAERGGEVALEKPSHRTLTLLWLATGFARICPSLIMGAISLDRITPTLRCNPPKRKQLRSSSALAKVCCEVTARIRCMLRVF